MGSVIGGKPEWETKELERKARVQALIKQLADESNEKRQAAYSELRDTVVRKRDIPELTKEIARNANPEVKKSLGKLIPFMDDKWRLPDKSWTTDIGECHKRYVKAIEDLGCDLALLDKKVVYRRNESGKAYADNPLELELIRLLETDLSIENRMGMENLILTLEPESLVLCDYWVDISFLGTLTNLEILDLSFTKVTDLTPLNGLPNLRVLCLQNTKVTDLTPLQGLPNLRSLYLQNVEVTDLTPLKGLKYLGYLDLRNTKVTDLTPLEDLPKLQIVGKGTE